MGNSRVFGREGENKEKKKIGQKESRVRLERKQEQGVLEEGRNGVNWDLIRKKRKARKWGELQSRRLVQV